jgi:hypothetical protein
MFLGITNKKQTARLQQKFGKVLEPFVSEQILTNLGTRAGSWSEKVNYSEELDLWWVLSKANNNTRYWNAFGIGKPKGSSNIVVEINYPIEEVDFRIAAHWTRDEKGNYFLFHSGKIGGGRKDIGQSSFRAHYTGDFYDIEVGGYVRNVALIGALEDAIFPYQLANFVNQVQSIKGDTDQGTADEQIHNFSKEFDGEKYYTLPNKVTANANHGIIVNSLKDILCKMGKQVASNGSTGKIDLYTYDSKNKINQLIEVKSSLSLQALYTAIGQLLMYSFPFSPTPSLIFVCPTGLPKKAEQLFAKLNISVIFYSWKKNKPQFINLKEVIK